MPMPKPRHGEICGNAVLILGEHAEDRDLGRVLSNDTGVITERGPDTVRGADISFYSFARVPKGPLPDRYLDTPPDMVVEVLSPSDRWPKVLAKVAEYLDAGTTVVLVLDDQRRLAHLYRADGTTRLLGADEELTIPDLLGDFRVRVGRFFEWSPAQSLNGRTTKNRPALLAVTPHYPGRALPVTRSTASDGNRCRGDGRLPAIDRVPRGADPRVELEHLDARGLGLLPGEGFPLGRRAEVGPGTSQIAGKDRQLLSLGRDAIGGLVGLSLRLVSRRDCRLGV